jgi:hypothetical protein
MFPVRCGLSLYILFRRNSVFKGLNTKMYLSLFFYVVFAFITGIYPSASNPCYTVFYIKYVLLLYICFLCYMHNWSSLLTRLEGKWL